MRGSGTRGVSEGFKRKGAKDQPIPPPPPQLTKETEDNLIYTNQDKVFDIIKTSNEIHSMLEEHHVEKQEIMEVLYSDKIFTF